MNKRGFTLIELLAVIVILAIIALIATPIILGIINDAKSSAKKRSAELVYTGVEYAYVTAMYNGTDGATVATPDLDAIQKYIKLDNVKKDNIKKETDKLTILTDDGAYCEVTVDGGFKVVCGPDKDSLGADKQYFEKTVSTSLNEATGA